MNQENPSFPVQATPAEESRTTISEDNPELVVSPHHSTSRSISSESSLSSTSTENSSLSSLRSTPIADGKKQLVSQPVGGQGSSASNGCGKLLVGERSVVYPLQGQTAEQQMRERELVKLIEEQRKQLKQLDQQVKCHEAAATRLPSQCYSMQCKPHGLAVVFGNEQFDFNPQRPFLQLVRREGTDSDIRCFASTFHQLGYKVLIHKNYSAVEIMNEVNRIVGLDHTAYDSIVLCFTTHGENNHFIFGSDSQTLNVYNLADRIQECPSLENKPKMLFVQACRVQPQMQRSAVLPDGMSSNPKADLYIAWATTRNSAAYRSPMHGSWFAVALYEVFIQCAQVDDLHTMMLKVNNIICSMEGVDMKIGCSTHQCLEMVERLRFSIYFQ